MSILFSDLNIKGMFGLSVNAYCEFAICGFRNGKNQTIKNHLGNIDELLKTETFFDKRSVELLGNLLQYAYRTLFEFDNDNIVQENELFEVIKKILKQKKVLKDFFSF